MAGTNQISLGARLATIVAAIALIAVGAEGAAFIVPSVARAGTLWINVGKKGIGNCDIFYPAGDLTGYSMSNDCSTGRGMSIVADVGGLTAGQSARWETDAPPGIAINSVTIPCGEMNVSNLNNGFGYGGGAFWGGAGVNFTSGQSCYSTTNLSSSFWEFQIVCGWSMCNNPASLNVSGLQIAATENTGPGMTAVGTGNLFYQGGHYVRGDGWPITLEATDPSGVCSMSADVQTELIPGPSYAPNQSTWQQCQSGWTWDEAHGAVVNTTQFYPGSGGPLTLTLTATNAAGVTSYAPMVLNVDNRPVTVALSSANDSDQVRWVNHAVTVNAVAQAGLSQVGEIDCASDGGQARSYPASGALVSVDGTGIHNVTCTATNQAVNAQGQVGRSDPMTFTAKIDETAPSVSFEPQNPSTPDQLIADTSDGQSGVAGGTIEMRPLAGGAWQPLSTRLDGRRLIASFDDTGLSGSYVFQAVSCDQVGNCALTSEQMILPLRQGAIAHLSFRKIVNPLHVKKVRERVRVGWHWGTVRRHGKRVRVKLGGWFKTITVLRAEEKCARIRVRVGAHRTQERIVCHPPHIVVAPSRRAAFGEATTIHGLLTSSQGIGLGGQAVHIRTAPANGENNFRTVATVITAANGSFEARLGPGPSRLLQASYAGTATVQPSTSTVAHLVVPAKIKIHIAPSAVAWRGTLQITGRVLGGYIPGGKLLRLRIGVAGVHETVGIPSVARDGRFHTSWTFTSGHGVVKYWFSVSTLGEPDYAYAPGSSARAYVTVGPG